MIWVMERAPIESPAEGMVLYALADRASDDGTAAWPSMQWIADRACCSRQTVRRHLRALEERGLIRRGDQRLVGHLRPDRRPVVWDLSLEMDRNTGVQSDTPPATGYQNEPHGVSNLTARGITGDTQTILNPPMNQRGEAEVEVTGGDHGDAAPSPESSPPTPPAAAGATPDTWCTSEHPRCREHAHIPAGDEVPSCRQCGNVRKWFKDRAALVVDAKRRAIEDCPTCDDRGFIETTDTTGRPVAAVCDHQRLPQPVDGPEVHRPVSDASTRRRMIAGLRRGSC